MQALIRSKSAGITGGRGTAGAGPGRDLLYCESRQSAMRGSSAAGLVGVWAESHVVIRVHVSPSGFESRQGSAGGAFSTAVGKWRPSPPELGGVLSPPPPPALGSATLQQVNSWQCRRSRPSPSLQMMKGSESWRCLLACLCGLLGVLSLPRRRVRVAKLLPLLLRESVNKLPWLNRVTSMFN